MHFKTMNTSFDNFSDHISHIQGFLHPIRLLFIEIKSFIDANFSRIAPGLFCKFHRGKKGRTLTKYTVI